MPIPAVPIVMGILAGTGGLSLGALIRQPEINKLKAQVTKLQEELANMQVLCRDALKDVEILKLKMQLHQNEDILAQLKGRDEMDVGRLIYAYGLKEYLEIKQKYLIEGKDITEREAVFADTFSMFLDNQVSDDENGRLQKAFIRGYLVEKYSAEIDALIPPNLMTVVSILESKVEEMRETKHERAGNESNRKVVPELECLSLNEEQTRFLYSIELIKIEYDIRTAKTDREKTAKTTWKNEWCRRILHGLDKDRDSRAYFIRDSMSLYAQMREAYDQSAQRGWYYLVAFEAALFVPYFPLNRDRRRDRVWKGLALNRDYMKEEFPHHQMIVDQALLEKMIRTYNQNVSRLAGTARKIVEAVIATSAVTVATGGLASVFAPGLAAALAGGSVSHLSGAALTSASLAFIGGGSLAAGGLGVAGGNAIITGGGAILGMAGSGAASVSAMVLLSTEGYTLRECAKLLSFSGAVLIDEFNMQSTVAKIQRAVEERIGEFGAKLAILKATPKADKKAIRSIETGMEYLGRCNRELLKMLAAKKTPS